MQCTLLPLSLRSATRTIAFITKVQIETELFWVVAAHDGTVLKGTDVLLSGEDADCLVSSIQERFPDANLITDERDGGPY